MIDGCIPVDFDLFLASLYLYRTPSCAWLALERVASSALICVALLHYPFLFWVGVHVAPRKSGVWFVPLLACSSECQIAGDDGLSHLCSLYLDHAVFYYVLWQVLGALCIYY